MAWKQSHKQETRERILVAAAKLFSKKGFYQVAIDEVMLAAGLTRGAFYAHFKSKHDLFEEAILYASQQASGAMQQGGGNIQTMLDNYLSKMHLYSEDFQCPLSGLVNQIAHEDKRVRDIYTLLFKGIANHMAAEEVDGMDSDSALLQVVLMIGGMTIARNLTDPALAARVLELCRRQARLPLQTI